MKSEINTNKFVKRRIIPIRTARNIMPADFLRFSVDLDERISRYDMVWAAPNGPAASWLEGAPIGNGDFGAMIYGHPDSLSFVLGKTDIWDRTPQKSWFNGGTFETVRRIYETRDLKAYNALADLPLPRCRQHATTSGMFRLRLQDDCLTISPTMRLSLATGVTCLTYRPVGHVSSKPAYGETQVDMFAARDPRVIVVRVRPTDYVPGKIGTSPKKMPLGRLVWDLSRQEHAPHPSATTGRTDCIFWLRQKFLSGDCYVIALISENSAGRIAPLGSRITGEITPGEKDAILYLTIVSSRDGMDPLAEAKARLERARRMGFDALFRRHRQWWRKNAARLSN